jgi:oxygen-independent coproporphyrinogen-3 oxidase
MTTAKRAPLTLPADHLGLYVHVPFCKRKCAYCDFASAPVCAVPQLEEQYLDAVAREGSEARAGLHRAVSSVFIGGGTPTALSGDQLRRLWDTVVAPFARTPDAEVTIEANPGTLSDDVMDALRAMPLTRVSLGVQSLDARDLKVLGRIHTAAEAEDAARRVRRALPVQLNLDLMYGIPGQSVAAWEETLARTLALEPDHLSLYSLIVEDGTPLAADVQAGRLRLPDEEVLEAQALAAESAISAAGHEYYEVSNAARPGMHGRHNLGYWLGRDYLGLGPSATSTMAGVRWRNVDDPAAYAARVLAGESPMVHVERLAARDRLLEIVMLGLRLRDGFDLAEAEAHCGCTLEAIAAPAMRALEREGLLEHDGPVLRLTARGFPLANVAVARLMAGR